MNKEIERKFKVKNKDFLKESVKSEKIIQGYLSKDPERTVRIRIKGDKGFLTVKGISVKNGTERFEYEKEISKTDASELLELCLPGIIEKTRYFIPYKNHIFEVDVFEGENKGLILAETELKSVNETFEKPAWLGEEVTGDKRFYNSYISENNLREINNNSAINRQDIVSKTAEKMILYFEKDIRRINHALKVFAYAKFICELENLSPEKKFITEISALLHDTGIKVCEEKYGYSTGKCQEIESPKIANDILSEFKLPKNELERILFIIGNHHSYDKTDDTDFQILVEADFLVNFEEGNEHKNKIPAVRKNIFRTKTGIKFLEKIF